MSYKGYLFGQYDSRGGTMFIIADNYEQALRHYEELLGYTEEALQECGVDSSGLDENYLGEATLDGITDEAIFERDLEEAGRVLMKGEYQDCGCGIDVNPEDGPFSLLFQPVSDGPLPEGYWQPVWNDDAYGFCVSDAKSATNAA